MSKKTDIKSELKALGSELAMALKQIRSSDEVAALKQDLTRTAKKLAADVGHAVKAAKASPSTARLKHRLGRLARAGKAQGTVELEKAKVVASKKILLARKKLVALARRVRERSKKN